MTRDFLIAYAERLAERAYKARVLAQRPELNPGLRKYENDRAEILSAQAELAVWHAARAS